MTTTVIGNLDTSPWHGAPYRRTGIKKAIRAMLRIQHITGHQDRRAEWSELLGLLQSTAFRFRLLREGPSEFRPLGSLVLEILLDAAPDEDIARDLGELWLRIDTTLFELRVIYWNADGSAVTPLFDFDGDTGVDRFLAALAVKVSSSTFAVTTG
jgi:hypothetical protein